MHFTASTAVAFLSIVASSCAADTTTAQSGTTTADAASINLGAGAPKGALATPNRASLVSELLAKVSSQVSNDPAVKSELSTISGASGADIPKDVATVIEAFAFSGSQSVATPAWISAAGSTGAVASLLNADGVAFLTNVAAAATPVSTSGVTSSMSMSMSTSSGLAPKGSSMASNGSSSASPATSASPGSSSASQSSPTSAKSTGGAASQPTGAIMAAGAAAAGVLGLAVLL